MATRGKTGLKLWKDRVQNVYTSLEDLRNYDSIYGIVARCGYLDAAALWNDNPMLQGSTNPGDFGIAR